MKTNKKALPLLLEQTLCLTLSPFFHVKYLKDMDVCACKDDTGNSICVCTYTLEYGHKAAICNFSPCIRVQNNMSFV